MKQPSLFKPKRSRTAIKAKWEAYDEANLRVAQDFIREPQLCGGADSFGMRWARLVIRRLSPLVDADTAGVVDAAL